MIKKSFPGHYNVLTISGTPYASERQPSLTMSTRRGPQRPSQRRSPVQRVSRRRKEPTGLTGPQSGRVRQIVDGSTHCPLSRGIVMRMITMLSSRLSSGILERSKPFCPPGQKGRCLQHHGDVVSNSHWKRPTIRQGLGHDPMTRLFGTWGFL